MPRRDVTVTMAPSTVEQLDKRAAELCVSRSVVVDALARADASGDVKGLAEHVAAAQAEVKAAEVERGKRVAHLGRAAQRKERSGDG